MKIKKICFIITKQIFTYFRKIKSDNFAIYGWKTIFFI